MALIQKNGVLLCFLFLIVPSMSLYCKVGYGQTIEQQNKYIHFWSKSLWTRNCPGATFCWEARPTIHSADAMADLVGGDWNDDYWGDTGGFVRGCQSDFGLDTQPTKGDFVNLARAVDGSESGVFVLDQFKGSGKNWEFRINEVCAEDLCSSASRILIGVLPLLLVGGMTMFLHILS